MRLTFDRPAHRYAIDGVYVPSVTQVLEAERLLYFGGASNESMEYARSLGTAVHSATELDDAGDLDEDSLADVAVPYLSAWRRFRAETGFVPSAIEQRVFHAAYRYAGTLDRLGSLPRAGAVIVDIKTGQPQRATGYQLAAYAACLPIAEQRRKRFGVYLRPDGTYSLTEYKDRGDLSVFLAALTLYNVRRKPE